MTGVIPAVTGSFMQEFERRRALADADRERQRSAMELQAMIQQLFPNANINPSAITPSTAAPITNVLQGRENQQAQAARQAKQDEWRQKDWEYQVSQDIQNRADKQTAAQQKAQSLADAYNSLIPEAQKYGITMPQLGQGETPSEIKIDFYQDSINRAAQRQGQKEYYDYTHPKEDTSKPLPYSDAQVRWVEGKMRDAAIGNANIEDVINDPAVRAVLDDLEQHDPQKYAELGRIYKSALIMQKERTTATPNINTNPQIQRRTRQNFDARTMY